MSNWKRTSEELPRKYRYVLIMTSIETIKMGAYIGNSWIVIGGVRNEIPCDFVVAWCPIPEYDLEDE